MAHEIAKLLLEKAGTFLERSEAIKAALTLGMPLSEIEAYLDWKESLNGPRRSPNPKLGIAPALGRPEAEVPTTEESAAPPTPLECSDSCSTVRRESS